MLIIIKDKYQSCFFLTYIKDYDLNIRLFNSYYTRGFGVYTLYFYTSPSGQTNPIERRMNIT